MTEAPLSRQQIWRVRTYRDGRCINCGESRGDSPYKRFCVPCAIVARRRRQKRTGYKSWRPGGTGMKPLRIK